MSIIVFWTAARSVKVFLIVGEISDTHDKGPFENRFVCIQDLSLKLLLAFTLLPVWTTYGAQNSVDNSTGSRDQFAVIK